VRAAFRGRRKYVPVGCVGDVLSPTPPKGRPHIDVAAASNLASSTQRRASPLRSRWRRCRRAPRGTVCAQGRAQTSRTDAISGVSREGLCDIGVMFDDANRWLARRV